MEDKERAKGQKQRLEQLIIHLKMNLVDLANLAGLNKNTLYHVGSGERSEMTLRTAARICYQLEKKGIVVNRDWLLDGVGEMIKEDLSVPVMDVAAEEETPYEKIDWREKYFDLLEKYTRLLESRQS